jgi:outer membrane protein TolC
MKKPLEMTRIHLTLAVVWTTFFGFGQQKLSAEGAVIIALENNFQMQIASKQLEIAEKNNKWSEAGLFPTVDLAATLGNSIIDNTNNPFTFTPGILASRQINPSINANWNLFAGLAVKMSKQRLEQLEDQSHGNAMILIENTASDVLKAYYNTLIQEMRLELLSEVYQLSKKQVAYEEIKKEYGQTNSLALMQLNNQLFTDSINVIQQRINYENASRNLLLLMNVGLDEIENNRLPVLTDSLTKLLNPFNKDELLDEMRANNQNLKNQLINQELTKTGTQLQRSFLYPVISLQLGAAPSFGSFRSISGSANLSAETQQVNYFGNISVRYNLFNNWKNQRAVEISKIQEEIAALNSQELEQQLTNSALNLYGIWEVRNQLVNLSQLNATYARQAFEIGKDRYALGSINSLELTALQNNYLNAAMNYYDNLYQRIDVYLELFKLSGRLQLEYTK